MSGLKLRSLGAVLLAIVCTAVLGVTSMLTSLFVLGARTLLADVALLSTDVGWIMGGTAVPVPPQDYINEVEGLYLSQFSGYNFQGLTTPEQFCPIICVPFEPNLNFGDSVNDGVTDLDNVLRPQLVAGDDVVVFGYSQSATIATAETEALISDGVNTDNLHLVLIGDPNNPIGGILDRFQFPNGLSAFNLDSVPQHLPFLNVPLGLDETPTTVASDIYSGEYDGWADFPRDPLNLLGDINALLGILIVHPTYPGLSNLDNAIDLGGIGESNYYMIPEELPILWPVYAIPFAGPPIADLFAPEVKMIIDWGYGNPGDPGAGITVDGVDPIGAAGPWEVTATGQLADTSGVAGLFTLMDPLQILAGVQNAVVHSIIDPINDIVTESYGANPVAPEFTAIINGFQDVLQVLSGYDVVNGVDQFLLTTWNDVIEGLTTGLNAVGLSALDPVVDALGPDAIFSGAPIIPGEPIIDTVGAVFNAFNFFGA